MSNQTIFAGARDVIVSGGTFTAAHTINNFVNARINVEHQADGLPAPQKPNSSALFTGRRVLVDRLKNHFGLCVTGEPLKRRSFLLYGMGGIGKTQICLKFMEEMENVFSHIFWIDASSTDTIIQSLKGISNDPSARLAGLDGSPQSILQWIAYLPEEWLIVFDNADGAPEVVESFLPPGLKGNVLITSRNKALGRLTQFENALEIYDMDEQDAISLLLTASGGLNQSDQLLKESAKKIVTELCCLPLAVAQAGAAIASGLCNIDDYLYLYSQKRQQLLSDSTFTGASKYNRTVYSTWELSLKEIESRARKDFKLNSVDVQAAQNAIFILETFAFFHHTGIDRSIFINAAKGFRESDRDYHSRGKFSQLSKTYLKKFKKFGAKWFHTSSCHLDIGIQKVDKKLEGFLMDQDGIWNEFYFQSGIQLLLSFSLVKKSPSGHVYSVHPLVHAWSRDRMSFSNKSGNSQRARTLLLWSIPLSYDHWDYIFCQRLIPHIKANNQNSAQAGIEKVYNDEEYTKFARVLYKNGNWKEAKDLEVQVLEARKRLLGLEHPETLSSMGNIAKLYSRLGRWTEAEELEIQVLEVRKKLIGLKHPDSLSSMNNLARIYSDLGKWKEAEELQVQVLEARKRVLGLEHPGTLSSLSNLARIYSRSGRWKEAEELEAQVLKVRQRLLGVKHPDTLSSMGNLARIYSDLGRWKETEELEVQVLKIRKKMLGPEHPDTLLSIGNLARIYSDLGRWKEAEKLEVLVLEARKRVLGLEHPNTLLSMGNLASTYNDLGRWKEAEELKVHVMEVRKKALGLEHPDTLSSISNLASTYSNLGRWKEAEKLQVQVLGVRKRVLGLEHPGTLSSMGNLARIYSDLGKWKEAEKLEAQVLEVRKRVLGLEHPNTLLSMGNLASTYSGLGRWKEAEELKVQVMEIRKCVLGQEHPNTLLSMGNLASTYSDLGRWKEAEELQAQVLKIRKRMLSLDHPGTLSSMSNLARIYSDLGRWKEAEKLDVQVLGIRKRVLGPEHPSTLLSTGNLASTYSNLQQWEEAEELQVQVLEARKRVLGLKHQDTLLSMGNLAMIYGNLGRWKEAKELTVQELKVRQRIVA